MHFRYFFNTPESSSETAQNLVSNKHLSVMIGKPAVPRCLHTLGLFLERRSTRFTDCPKGSYKFVCCTWEQGRKARSHTHGTSMARFPLASMTLDWTHINSNIVHVPKSLSNEYGITNFVDSKKSFCSHPKPLGVKHS